MTRSFHAPTPRFRLPNPMIPVVWLAVFIPGHFYEWWVERAFVGAVFALSLFILLAKPAPWETRKAARRASALFFLIQFFYLLSFVYSVAFNGIETGPRDYFDLLRYVFCWAFVLYVLRHHDDRVRRGTEAALAAAAYFCLVVAVCYLRPVPFLSSFFREFLYAQTKTAVNWLGQLRLSAPFENPNFLGFFMVQALAYHLFFSRSALRHAHAFATLLVVYFTGSRTAWAATTVVLSAAFAGYSYDLAKRLQLKRAVQLSAALFVLVLGGFRFGAAIASNYRVQAILKALHRGGVQNEANAAGRLEQNLEVWEYVKRSPVLGWGPSKYEIFDYVDDQYALWALRNGAVGTLLILGGLVWAAWRLLSAQKGDAMRTIGALAFVAAVALELVTGEFLGNFRLFYLTWFVGTAMARGRE